MDVNSQYWECLNSLTNVSSFKEQADIFRYFAHLESILKVDSLIKRYINDFPAKLAANLFLTTSEYNLQCQSFVTPFLFQPPLFPCSNFEQRKYYNDLFSNWKPNDYCMDFYKKLKTALGIDGTN